MKYRKAIYAAGSLIIIAAALVKILHLPFSDKSNLVIQLTVIGMFAFQSWHLRTLERRIQELEKN